MCEGPCRRRVLALDGSQTHLACADQFVVSELGQLGPQGEVRIHQECLPAALVEVLERQSCTQSATIICQTSVNTNIIYQEFR